ncbi:Large ribosomal subunit protein [Trichinella spiralis]|uniref:Large ribosomal subunit protein n=1 Tax=Trichinella spiralis TaxID=6334 RepID=A0ABR3KCF6_TRISP
MLGAFAFNYLFLHCLKLLSHFASVNCSLCHLSGITDRRVIETSISKLSNFCFYVVNKEKQRWHQKGLD